MASFTLSLVDKVTAPAKAANGSLTDIVKGLKDVMVNGADSGPVLAQVGSGFGELVNKAFPASDAMQKVSAVLAGLGPEGEAVAVVLQVVVGVVTGLAQVLYDWAAAAVTAAGKRDALVATFNALGAGANAGEATLAATTALAAQLPFVTSKVNEWAKSLMAAGIQGKAMDAGVKAIAASTAIMGDSGGSATQGLIKRFAMLAETGQKVKLDRRIMTQLAEAGVSATALATALGVPVEKLGKLTLSAGKLGAAMQTALIQKGAPALEAMGLTWDSIKAKLDEGIGSLFSGASDAVRPFMAEVKSLFAEFNKGSATMGVGKGIMTAVLTSLFEVAAKVVHAIHYGFLTVEIAALKVAIAIAPIVLGFRKILTNATVLQGLKVILMAIVAPIVLIGVVLGVIVAVVLAVGIAFVYVFTLITAGIAYVVGAISGFVGWVGTALGRMATDAYDAAGDFIAGLVNGITAGLGAVISAASGLASGALTAFKSVLGIHSPSRVMFKYGGYMSQGVALGMDAGTTQVQRSAQSLGGDAIANVVAGATGPGASKGGSGASSSGASIVFEKGAFQINGAGMSALEITEEMVALVFERLALSRGLMGRPA